ncbi:hypothetical protein ACTXT7_006102 [Hymenolepis weldensis]
MSANFNKDISAISTSSNFMQFSVPNSNVDSKPFNISKPGTMLPSPSAASSPMINLNSTEPKIVNDFVAKSGNNKHTSDQQRIHAGVSHQQTSNHSNPNLNLRYRNMLNFPKYLHKKSMAFEKRIKRSGIITDPTWTLKLLQQFLQPSINREIDAIIKKYSEVNFAATLFFFS